MMRMIAAIVLGFLCASPAWATNLKRFMLIGDSIQSGIGVTNAAALAANLLADGANVVGRGREADVRVGVPEVSRRHARIDVAGGRATVEDLESRNGTFVRGRRIQGATPLADGDEVSFGPEPVVFCAPSESRTTRVVRKRRR